MGEAGGAVTNIPWKYLGNRPAWPLQVFKGNIRRKYSSEIFAINIPHINFLKYYLVKYLYKYNKLYVIMINNININKFIINYIKYIYVSLCLHVQNRRKK